MTKEMAELDPQEYAIESGVPMPEPRAKYPFAKMSVGDSFAFDVKQLNNVRGGATTWSKRHSGTGFSCRQVGTAVWRCWRTK